ncbi:sirohydrochlorin chelatase [Paenibacillus sp. YYML68]|uniref:sirohydrochlorin chelatase n=1 Tax=Paenibacillus sp. YYML68 TaxID=2909250 RepID=UPI00248FC966|nr:CbiX/SirB N-terminal domain-containing protein [Paenibacillus sp. YYML68]
MVKYGVLVISHGSRSAEWVRLVDEAVSSVKVPYGVPVYSSFLEIVEGRLIQDGITQLESIGVTDIIVVPLFVSSGSTHIDEIEYALGLKDEPLLPTDMERFAVQARLHMTPPIDDDPIIADILYEKLMPLSDNPEQELVLLVGHGSIEKGFHLRWRQGLELLADRLKSRGGFAEADGVMLLPNQVKWKLKLWNRRRPDCTVLVAPLFLSEGYFTSEVIPDRFRDYEYRYNGATLLPHPGISRWMERQIEAAIQCMEEEGTRDIRS